MAAALVHAPKYDAATVEAVLRFVADGLSLRQIEQQPGMPSRDTMRRWLAADQNLQAQFARAKEDAADQLFEEITALADEPPPSVDGRVDSGWVQWQKNRIDARKFTAAKLAPKKYGDRIQFEHSVGVTLTAAMVRERLAADPEVEKLVAGRVVKSQQAAAGESGGSA